MCSAMYLFLVAAWATAVAGLSLTQNDSVIVLANSNLTVMASKARGVIVDLGLNGQDLLGPTTGSKGIGPYLDCYCIPAGFYTAGPTAPHWDTVRGIDPSGTSDGGVILSETYAETGQQLNNTPTDAYYTQFSEYSTKYTFSTSISISCTRGTE